MVVKRSPRGNSGLDCLSPRVQSQATAKEIAFQGDFALRPRRAQPFYPRTSSQPARATLTSQAALPRLSAPAGRPRMKTSVHRHGLSIERLGHSHDAAQIRRGGRRPQSTFQKCNCRRSRRHTFWTPVQDARQGRDFHGCFRAKFTEAPWHHRCSGPRTMRGGLDRHLEQCRRQGLYIDEDFERGWARRRGTTRAVALVILLAALVATVTAIARPTLVEALFAPAVMAPQTHHPDARAPHPPFRRAIVRARAPRAYA
jgi:hypothetical protein